MIHKMTVLIDLLYDDDDGEYAVPKTAMVERIIANAIYGQLIREGFDRKQNVEVANGSSKEAFGI